jgi:hypothetical protein
VSPEKTYLVRRSDSGEREYRLYELTWLWRTAALPHDAIFKHPNGEWRSVSELVEPILEAEKRSSAARERETQHPVESARSRRSHRWLWVGAFLILLAVVSISLGPGLRREYSAIKSADVAERRALEQERSTRLEDFVSDKQIVPGMTPEQVRRVLGPPNSMKATGDASLERWIYRQQVVVFENGKVTGVEASK